MQAPGRLSPRDAAGTLRAMDTLLALLAVGVAALFWSDSVRTREVALQAAARACRDTRVQLLDQTVSLKGLRPVRGAGGGPALQRSYGFELTADGIGRHPGTVVLVGRHVQTVHMELPEGSTVVDGSISPSS